MYDHRSPVCVDPGPFERRLCWCGELSSTNHRLQDNKPLCVVEPAALDVLMRTRVAVQTQVEESARMSRGHRGCCLSLVNTNQSGSNAGSSRGQKWGTNIYKMMTHYYVTGSGLKWSTSQGPRVRCKTTVTINAQKRNHYVVTVYPRISNYWCVILQ